MPLKLTNSPLFVYDFASKILNFAAKVLEFAKNKKKKRYNLTFVNKFMANIWLNLWIFCHPFVPVVEILVGTHIGHFSGEFVNV